MIAISNILKNNGHIINCHQVVVYKNCFWEFFQMFCLCQILCTDRKINKKAIHTPQIDYETLPTMFKIKD